MDFEWDPSKNAANIARHGIDFDEACRIFDGPTLEQVDDRQDYRETRIAAIGTVEGRELYVVYTMRGERCRMISARRANRYERQAYHRAFGG